MKTFTFFLLCLVMATSACYQITVSSGKKGGVSPVAYEERWHYGAIYGMVEILGNYNLDEICPSGWAEIQTKTSFVNGVVVALTSAFGGLYSPQTITIICQEKLSKKPLRKAKEKLSKTPRKKN